jgi:hypothetical protein
MLVLNEAGVDIFIKRFGGGATQSFWNNYELVIWNKNASGYSSPNGMFKGDAWGLAHRVQINNDGVWKLPKKYVKYFK